MNARHVIETMDFALADAAPETGLHDEQALARLLREQLLPAVEQALEACDEPGTVLALPALELDLGTIPRADFHAEAARRLRVALLDALDGARRRASGSALATGDPAAQATLHGETDRLLAQLVMFLDTGRLPWHAGVARTDAHVALLDRLLADGGERLRAALAVALAQPHGARRLAEQFPPRQLRALVASAGAPGAVPVDVDVDADGAAAHRLVDMLREELAAPRRAARAHGDGDPVAALAAFLRGGRLPEAEVAAAGGAAHVPAHARLFERALDAPVAVLRAMLREVLAHHDSARRLLAQYPAEQLAALARRCAPAHAATLLARLPVHASGQDWRNVLAACLQDGETTTAEVAPAGEHAALADDLARLAAFLHGGPPLPAAATVLERLAAAPDGAGPLLRMLRHAAADPVAMERLARAVPAGTLPYLAGRLAPAHAQRDAAWVRACLEEAVQAGAAAAQLRALAQLCWRHVLRAALVAAPLPPMADALTAAGLAFAAASSVSAVPVAQSALQRLVAYLESGQVDGGAALTPALLVEQMLAAPPSPQALAAALARALVTRQAMRRLLEAVPAPLLERLAELAAPGRAPQVLASARARHAAAPVHAGTTALARLDAAALERALVALLCRRDAGAGRAAAVAATPARARLLAFLASGRMAGTPEAPSPAALLDAVLAGADAALWPALAATVAAPGALRRLLEQFPERQWRALVRLAQPVQGAALCALADAAGATAAARQEAWGVLLRAAVRCPGMPLVPAALRAEVAAAMHSDAGSDAAVRLVRWLHTGQAGRPADASPAAILAAAMSGAPAPLRTALAAALARPAAARRLATLVPQAQLEALLWLAAPAAAADAIEAVDEVRALAVARGADEVRAETLAARCRHNAVDSLLAEAPATPTVLRARLHAVLDCGAADPQGRAPGGGPRSKLERLACFLATGRLDPSDTDGTEPAHVILLDELLAAPPATLASVLADALARPASRRRLVEQFPDRLLLAVLGLGHAAMNAQRPPAHAAPAAQQRLAFWRDLVALVLGDGALDPAAVGLTPAAMLERLVGPGWGESIGPDAEPGILPMLAAILAEPGQAARLVERVPEPRLWRIVRLALPAWHGTAPPDVPVALGAAEDERVACWLALLATDLPAWRAGCAAAPTAPGPGPACGVPPDHVACLDALMAAPGAALWTFLAAALAHPASARRLVTRFPARQLDALAALAPRPATACACQGEEPVSANGEPQRWHAPLAGAIAQARKMFGLEGRGDLAALPADVTASSERALAAAAGAAQPSHASMPTQTPAQQAGAAREPADGLPAVPVDAGRPGTAEQPPANHTAGVASPAPQPTAATAQASLAPPSADRAQTPLLAYLATYLAAEDEPDEGAGLPTALAPAALARRAAPTEQRSGIQGAIALPAPDAYKEAPAAYVLSWRPVRPGPTAGAPIFPAAAVVADPPSLDALAEPRSITAPGTAAQAEQPAPARCIRVTTRPTGNVGATIMPADAATPPRDGQDLEPRQGAMPAASVPAAAHQEPGAPAFLQAAGTGAASALARGPAPAPWRTTPTDERNTRLIRAALRAIPMAEEGGAYDHAAAPRGAVLGPAARQHVRCDSVAAALADDGAGTGAAERDALIVALLSGTGAMAGQSAPMLAEQGPTAAATLRSLIAGPGARAALAAGLPDAALSRLVAMIRPGQTVLPPRPGSAAPARHRHWREALAAAARKRDRPPGPATTVPELAPARQHWPRLAAREPEPLPEGERLALPNAGMVLLAPYLPRLFAVLGLVAEGSFADTAAAERAALLLQFAVTGVASAPEYQLPLNKLMCGLAAEAPLPLAIDVTEQERATVASLLEAMIATWSALGRTSIDGFRAAFLVRQGELLRGAEDWSLSVAAGPFDMLMDRLPWSFSIIRYPWMKEPIHVTWQRT